MVIHMKTLYVYSVMLGAQIYETDIHGSIVITTNGEDYEIQLETPAPSVKLATEGQPTEVK